MRKWVLVLTLVILCSWDFAFLVSAQGPNYNLQGYKRVFRYNQYDTPYARSSMSGEVWYYPYLHFRNTVTSVPTWKHPLILPKNIPSTYVAYDTYLTQASYIAVGDLENDGFNDLVSSSYYDGYIAILHQSTTTHQLELVALWDVTHGGVTNGVRDVFIADMNGDCLKDIVAFDSLNGLVAIFHQTSEYGIFIRTQVDTGMMYSRGGIGDLNTDGLTDLIWTEGRSVYVAYQIPNGFSAPARFSVPSIPYGLLDQPAVGDVNGDGRPDLIVVDGYLNRLFVWESPGMQLRILGAPNNVSENVSVGDLDRDGIADIVIPGSGTDQVAITWGGAFTTTMLSGVGNLKDVDIGDIDNDSQLELVATDQQSYNLVIWKPHGRTASLRIVPANVIPGEIVIADLNGDGLRDVAYGISGWTTPPHAPVTVHYQEGNGIVIPRFDPCTPRRYYFFPLIYR